MKIEMFGLVRNSDGLLTTPLFSTCLGLKAYPAQGCTVTPFTCVNGPEIIVAKSQRKPAKKKAKTTRRH